MVYTLQWGATSTLNEFTTQLVTTLEHAVLMPQDNHNRHYHLQGLVWHGRPLLEEGWPRQTSPYKWSAMPDYVRTLCPFNVTFVLTNTIVMQIFFSC